MRVTWDESRAEQRGTDDLYAAYRTLAARPGTPAKRAGNAAGALRRATKVVEAIYEFPYLAHAPMEPLDAVIRVGADGCDFWAGSQFPTGDQQAVARVLGLPPDKVRVHTLLAGGSFGRRATPDADIASEAASWRSVGGARLSRWCDARGRHPGGGIAPLLLACAAGDAQANSVGGSTARRSINCAGTPFNPPW